MKLIQNTAAFIVIIICAAMIRLAANLPEQFLSISLTIFFLAFAFAGAIYILFLNTPAPAPKQYTEDSSKLKDMASYLDVDMTFSPEKIEKKLSGTYTLFQKCWQDKDLSPLRMHMSDSLYSQMDMQLDQYRKAHQTNRLERMSVRRVELLGWKQDGDYDIVLAELETRVIDYVTDDISGEMIGGSTEEFKYSTYKCTLIRKRGGSVVTSRPELKKCPQCGALVRINSTAKCDYCGSVITNLAKDWTLSNIELLNQRRVDKNIVRVKK
ncbi:MAG: zinc-ribbon domain-containing transport protein [Ruminococcus sp.]|uniref:TIM44-like domain-containing protein n=1 Tax=Ruminococcus sp. TaxID=41978 RepID=UPI0025FE0B6E|nr:TIM44-like domain-containing protein [Ruminococcus sp.]MCR5601751.1 zinc-ribbon domain-containing transport protein [Ruminococcus sp.]